MVATSDIKFINRNTPACALDEVRETAARLYGFSGSFRALDSERDQNFFVRTDAGERYVLKLANAAESAAVIDFQIKALQHIAIANPALPIPRVVVSKQAEDSHIVRFASGLDHIVYVLTYLEGDLLAESRMPLDTAVRYRLGGILANVDLALRGFFHPSAVQEHPWNLGTCLRLQPLTVHIENDAHRAEVDQVFARMHDLVLPKIHKLRHQVVHQDAHGENVLVDCHEPSTIAGLLDFGDLLYGSLAAEVAVACDGVSHGCKDIVTPACDVVAGFDSVLGLEEDEIDTIFDLVCARNAMTITIAAARLALTPEQPAHVQSPMRYVEHLRALEAVGREKYSESLRAACRFPSCCPQSPDEAASHEDEDRLIAARHALMGRKTTHFYDRPMHFERANGPWLYATDGRRYLDCYNNVPQVGHCHPHVVKAISRQAAVLNTNTRYLYGSAIEYADRLTGKLAPHLTACVFVNSGSEANDVAWQMAKLVTGKTGAIIMEDAYHGVTDVIRQFSPGRPGTDLPAFLRGLTVPDPYRGPYRENDGHCMEKYVADADRPISELRESGHGIAAFMIDSAFCSSGVPNVPQGYLQGIEAKIRAAGGLMICDEVQSGFGRMGQWWGHEHHGVRADIVTMGKPVGNGHPLGVVVTTDEILNLFIDKTRLFSTFGGNTVACAAGNAVLDVIERENLIDNGKQMGHYLRSGIRNLAKRHRLIGDVRGHGMVTGLEFVSDRKTRTPATTQTARLLELMRERRVLVGSEGRDANILKLRPALVFQKEHVDRFIDALDDSLAAL